MQFFRIYHSKTGIPIRFYEAKILHDIMIISGIKFPENILIREIKNIASANKKIVIINNTHHQNNHY